MDEEASQRTHDSKPFAERFEDLFTRKMYAIVALGVFLAWIWMGLTEGYPAFMDGRVDAASVALVMCSTAASLFASGYVHKLYPLLVWPAFWVACAVCTSVLCFALLFAFYTIVPVSAHVRMVVVRICMVPLGLAVGVFIQCCGAAFACVRPVSAAVGFFVSCSVMFATYFSLHVCGGTGGKFLEGCLFCLLPLLYGALLFGARKPVAQRLQEWPEEPSGFASGYRWMVTSFGVFFFAMSAKATIEPTNEFAVASDTSVLGILLLSIVFLYVVAIKSEPVGVFSLLKKNYLAAVIVLTVSIALAPLSLDPYMSIVFNADCVVLIMVLWLLASFVAHANEVHVCKVIGFALGVAALGLACGWLFGKGVFALLGHSRNYASIGLACATAVFATAGFSSKNFPYLTNHGEAAKKMQREKASSQISYAECNRRLAEAAGLSARECEVLLLLAEGYNAVAVADELVISYATSRTHVRNIYKKLDVHSHAELIERCKRNYDECNALAST